MQLESTGSAYHRLHIRMYSAGRLCAFDIGGLQPLHGQLSHLVMCRRHTHDELVEMAVWQLWATDIDGA